MRKRILIIIITIMVGGCGSSSTVNTTQPISFLNYRMNITTDYATQPITDNIDNRIAKKVVAIYKKPSTNLDFTDNIIISQDMLTPRANLEDYVQAAIGGISYTRGKYQSLSFKKETLVCKNISLPKITNSFSIYRTPLNRSPETIYFTQIYIHKGEDIVIISASTNNKDSLDGISTMLTTVTCTHI